MSSKEFALGIAKRIEVGNELRKNRKPVYEMSNTTQTTDDLIREFFKSLFKDRPSLAVEFYREWKEFSSGSFQKTDEAAFKMANDSAFIDAIMDAEDGAPSLQRSKFKTIGDRVRLIKELEKRGYIIQKINNK